MLTNFFFHSLRLSSLTSVMLTVIVLLCGCGNETSGNADREVIASSADSLRSTYKQMILESADVAPAAADSLLNLAGEYFNSVGDKEKFAEVLVIRAARKNRNSDYTQALIYIDSAMLLVDEIKSTKRIIKLYNAAGNINAKLGNNVTAIKMFDYLYDVSEIANDTNGMIMALGNTALVYGDLHDLENSKKNIYKSLALSNATEDYFSTAIAHMSLSYIYLNDEKIIDSAYYHCSIAIELLNEFCFEPLRPILTINMADVNTSLGKPALAKRELNGLIAELGDQMSPREYAVAYIILARAESKLNKYEQALHLLHLADELIEAMQHPWLKVQVEKEFYKTYKAMGNNQLAFYYFESYTERDQEQTGMKTQRQIADLKNHSIARQKEREIANLKLARLAQNSKLNIKRCGFYIIVLTIFMAMVLYYSNYQNHQKAVFATKEKLIAEGKLAILRSRINPDFILNSFAGVQSYLLKSNRMQAYTYLGKFASLLRTVINNDGETFTDLELEASILSDFLELEAMRFQENLTYEVNLSPELIGISNKIPGMIIQPYIESRIKGKLVNGDQQLHLVVNFRKSIEGIVVSIMDDDPLINAQLIPNNRKRLAFLRQIGYANARVEINNNNNEVLIYLPTT